MRLIIIIIIFQFPTIYAQEIKKNIFGFATSNTFTYCNVFDTTFTNKVRLMNPQILRFPGGAVGNFYHYGKSGYGFDFMEIDRYHNGKFPKRARGLNSSRKKNKHQHNYINDFISLAKITKAKAVLVANPFVENDNDIILMIQELNENNIEVVGVELGSELSNRSYFLKGYTIDDYILFAQRCSNSIKKIFPDMKTAIVAAPLGKRKGHRHNVWNSRLSKMDFYDAIIIHSYAKVIKGKVLDGQMLYEEIETLDKQKEFERYKKRAINYLTKEYPKEIQEYLNIYSMPIWVTEWNLQMSKTTGNTLLQSLFTAQYLLEVLSNPKFSSINLTTYHNLGGRDLSGSIFRNNNGRMDIQSTYFPMRMISKIFESNIVKINKYQTEEVYIYTCYTKNNEEVLRYILDWEAHDFTCVFTSSQDTIVHKSLNLFDNADSSGKFRF